MLADVVAKDIPEFISILTSLNTHATDSASHIGQLRKRIHEEDVGRENGLSFLEMKCHLILEYLINLTYTMILKIDGHSLIEHPCIERLVEIRTVLEKIRPIDKKLSYQIDKLVKMATADINQSEKHPLSFKPNLENLVGKDEEEKDDDDDDDDADTPSVYVPPKVTAVPYDEESKASQKVKKLEKARQRSLNKGLLEDLRAEYGEAPDEVKSMSVSNKRAKIKEKQEERERFEEDNMRRLAVTKKDKLMKRQLNELDEVVKLGNFKSMDDEESSSDERYQPKKKKKKGKFGAKGNKFKKKMQKRFK